jgi:Eco57I restriction-modification methylase
MTAFSSLKIVGGLLPADLLGRVSAADPQVPGTGPETYGLERGESVRRQASRSWLYLLEVWQEFKRRIDGAGDGRDGTEVRSARVTRERWLRILLRELGFHQMAGGSFELEGKSFPVSHRSGHVPIHLLGWATDLDHKTPHVTARAPQSMLQELLNRDDACLWAILSNGATLRLLRDSTALVGSCYVEFDLEAIFDGELFSDFVLLYLTCHESRFAAQGDGGPESCYLEQWRAFAAGQGERALNQLRVGVQQAISILGTGFLSHPANPHLRNRLDPRNADLKLDDLNRSLLRLVYRMLFWFVAEDRGALLQPDPADADAATKARLREARDRYAAYFSSARLRQMARRHRGGRHVDLFDAVQLVFDALGTGSGVPELALPGIGGIFESQRDDGTPLPLDEPLAGARLSNEALLGAVRAMSLVKPREGGALRRVDFGNLGAEELGSVYESLLELIPHYDDEQLAYTLEALPGNERKETGSYYTPTSLVECLLDSALDPLLDEASAHGTAEERVAALLNLTVCDPACGSGHFLVAAARRIAKRIAAQETGESEPPDAVVRAALRRVVGRCMYGVDLNPMAAELAKVSLWLEALEPGKPLSYLDQNIRVGNSLLGVTPALLAEGLPDAAFTPIEGDDRKVCSALKKQNAVERQGQHDLFSQSGIPVTNAVLAKRAGEIVHTLPENLEDLHIHQQRQAAELAASPERRIQKLLADAWCAAFMQPKTDVTRSTAITQAVLESFAKTSGTLDLAAAEQLVADLTRQYRFFHWHVEFPHIFRVGDTTIDTDLQTGWAGGFNCIIGNPPWEKVKLQEKEFFAAHGSKIRDLAGAKRKKAITALITVDPALWREYQLALRQADGEGHVLRRSGRYRLSGRGDVNTYAVFAEDMRSIVASTGRIGCLVPSAIATDNTTKELFSDLLASRQIVSLFEFENEHFFPSTGQGHMNRFCLLTLAGKKRPQPPAQFVFQATALTELLDPDRHFTLSSDDLSLLNPNTHTSPIFRTKRDAEITKAIYRRVPVLIQKSPERNSWLIRLFTMFHMTNDSVLFRTADELRAKGAYLDGNVFRTPSEIWLPLYEAKMIFQYDHRYGDYSHTRDGKRAHILPEVEEKLHNDPSYSPQPYYWVSESTIRAGNQGTWNHKWFIGWRGIGDARASARTLVSTIIPFAGVGNSFPLVLCNREPARLSCFVANLNSFILDYVARFKVAGLNLNFFIIEQLPVLQQEAFDSPLPWERSRVAEEWIVSRVLELVYSSWDMAEFARDLGEEGPPFRWDEGRRFRMRAELDAVFFHLYGIGREDVDYIMETFPIVKRRDEQRYGKYRTKELILEVYDAMAEAIRSRKPYQTILSPPPGQGPRHR